MRGPTGRTVLQRKAAQLRLQQHASEFGPSYGRNGRRDRVRIHLTIPLTQDVCRLACPLRGILRVVYGIYKFVGYKTIEFGIDISFEGQHVGDRKLPAGPEYAINPVSAPRSLPLHADGVRVTVRCDSPVRSGDEPRGGIQQVR